MFVQTSSRLKQTRPIGTNIGANQEGTARSTTAGSTRPSCAGRPGPQGQAAPQGEARAPQGRARGAARQDPRDQADIGEAGRGRGPRAPRGLGGRHRGRQGRRRLPGHARRPREPPAGGRALAGPHQEGGRRDAGGGPRGHPETKTMTLDRGMEFAGFAEVTNEEVRAVYDELNRRPRKCLGFRTPNEATTRRCCTCCENSSPNIRQPNKVQLRRPKTIRQAHFLQVGFCALNAP